MSHTIRFYIETTQAQVDQLAQELADAGIHNFSPVRNMVHIPSDNMRHSIFTGNDGDYAIKEMNRCLDRMCSPVRLPQGFDHMTTGARAELLALATDNTLWSTSYGPTALWVDEEAARRFVEYHPAPEIPAPPPFRPPYRQLRFPSLPEAWSPARPCPVPGCNHRSGFGRESKYCWGHSQADHTWDGLHWTTFDKALHGHECRCGKDGGMFDCNQAQVHDHLRDRYTAERERLTAGTVPVPGP